MSQTILVTGGAGFIGSNFVPYFCQKYPQYQIINLDKLTYAGSTDNLSECETMPNYHFVKGDICDEKLIESLFEKYDIQGVIHFAAESHVDNSIKNPKEFVNTNLVGTFNLLETARKHWMISSHQTKERYEQCRFHHISTDEVYGSLGEDGFFSENTPYAPNSPYSATKAGSDFLVRAYFHTYGMNVTTSNCSNNYGPKQHIEKLIPCMISKALKGEKLPIYGQGLNIRDWLYVEDHCKAIDLIFHQGEAGETYNIGGHNEKNNITIVKTICKLLDLYVPRSDGSRYESLITFVQDRAGHDFRYAINSEKLEKKLGWKAQETFDNGIKKTIEWYLKNTNIIK